MQSINAHSKPSRSNRPTRTLSTTRPHKMPDRTIQLANKSNMDYSSRLREPPRKKAIMTTQKKIIIGTQPNLVEATVYNRSEVVEYLKQRDWHLDTDSFVEIAADEYCLVNNKALGPGMNVLNEEVVHTWSTADITQSEELRAHEARFRAVCRLFQVEILLIGMVTMIAMLISWKSFGMVEGAIAGLVGICFILLKLVAFSVATD